MKIVQLQQVNFGIAKPEGEDAPVILEFADVRQVAPGFSVPIEVIQIHFDQQGWRNFQRAVAADGKAQPILVARGMPQV